MANKKVRTIEKTIKKNKNEEKNMQKVEKYA